MMTPSSLTNPTSKRKRYKMILARHPYHRLRHASEIPLPSSSTESSKSLHLESGAEFDKDTSKTPLKPTIYTNFHVIPPSFSCLSSQRKPRVIILDSESIETIVVDSESFDEDNVVLSHVLKRKATAIAPCAKGDTPERPKKPKTTRPTNVEELYEKLFGTPISSHEAPSSGKHPSKSTLSSSKIPPTTDETIDNLFAKFFHAPGLHDSCVPHHSTQNEPIFELAPPSPFTTSNDPLVHTTKPSQPVASKSPWSTVPSSTSKSILVAYGATSKKPFRVPSRSQNVVTTKAVRRKDPPNVPTILIDGISFHSEDVCLSGRLLPTITAVGPFYPKVIQEFIVNLSADLNDRGTLEFQKVHVQEQLTLELLGRFIHQWFSDGNFSVMKLSIKHVILYKIYITNWHPTSHLSTISTTLANLIYLVGTGSKHPNILTEFDVPEPTPKTIRLNYKMFQATHVLDLPSKFKLPCAGFQSIAMNLNIPSSGLHISSELASRLIQLLANESQYLNVTI
ncbi:flocculation protein FLO11-like [Cucumis melo var. makuwa]|uniref:Flocculation protein FLO11-like n=1 Tax=Cucumis melo var. makuwa TaxID=1194695 RepID=A0A5D3BFA1_CUCMM|nr:flocculation protein FLO11-like [Cucumis melo var. makuwa]